MEIVITKLHYIPYFGAFVGVVGIVTSYAIAVSKGDVDPWLPYISDAGGDPPQSSVFSFSMILVSLCFLVGCCLCYMIITVMNASQDGIVKWLSRLIPLAGAGCSAGMVLLAINPVGHLRRDGSWLLPIFVPHIIGAVGMFASGISLMWILALCNYFLDYGAWKTSFYARCLIAIIGVISGVMTISYCPISQAEHLGPLPNSPRMYPDGILVSTISEWVVVLTFMAFTTSFAAEFRKFKLRLNLEYIAEPHSSRAQLKTPAESLGETSLKEESPTSQQ
ncbi:DNA damage-regulated autophagy modulator protein 1-like [Dermacentor andersoni]|uniref:DNA damage-regulated autophagy modulator protein 1-like n=1 Tax=Dermacentor andersoni TaxID=34620 RepID=UPI002155B1AA|nr:DNA damage-regulated autophagy modulator protein 1-like [Dermacentor andersoni]XP_050040610.1 DNA damage-regulated autophagy modulator protein 1-like [Dermacentor andersoni]XP_054930331.1 DNA damage-regulated autophagy modulator protein 1-like [Dermacentor andersoni]